MRLFTSRMCLPPPTGNSEVRKGKPLISPATRNWPRVPQILPTSNGIRMIVQPSRDGIRSSAARNVFAIGFGLRFTRVRRGAILLRRTLRLILLRGGVHSCACSFFDGANAVDVYVLEFFEQAAGPAHLHPVDLGGSAQPEVHPHVVVGIEAGPPAHLVHQRAPPNPHSDARADSIAIRLRADRAKRYPVIGCAHLIDEQAWRRGHVADDRREAAGVPNIAYGQPSR